MQCTTAIITIITILGSIQLAESRFGFTVKVVSDSVKKYIQLVNMKPD